MTQNTTLYFKNKALYITLCGEVKGVGFRRYVWRVAKTLNLKGYVENVSGRDCVKIYVEGDIDMINELKNRIISNKVYRIEYIETLEHVYTDKYNDFTIVKCVGEEEY
uniref:acylphosphatase n=1 Tax=Ignisphaera aggregans TaxID=334771 RepID=A0A7C5TJM0_9CREN